MGVFWIRIVRRVTASDVRLLTSRSRLGMISKTSRVCATNRGVPPTEPVTLHRPRWCNAVLEDDVATRRAKMNNIDDVDESEWFPRRCARATNSVQHNGDGNTQAKPARSWKKSTRRTSAVSISPIGCIREPLQPSLVPCRLYLPEDPARMTDWCFRLKQSSLRCKRKLRQPHQPARPACFSAASKRALFVEST
jgi:hypothetical protein